MTTAPASEPIHGPARRSGAVKLLHGATRTVCAVALSYALSLLLHLAQPWWAMITALAILGVSTSQTLNAGRDQTIGAAIGAVVGVAAILVTLQTGHRLAVFFAFLVPLALAIAWRPSLRLAATTLIIVLLVPTDASLFMRAIDRVLEILVGVGSGVCVAYVLFRSRTQRVAYDRGVDMLRALAVQARTVLAVGDDGRQDRQAIDAGDDRVGTCLTAAIAAVDTARREGGTTAPHSPLFATRMLPALRRLQSDLVFVDRAVAVQGVEDDGREALERVGERLAALLDALADTVAAPRPTETLDAAHKAEAAFDAAIGALGTDRALTLCFVLRMVLRDAADLAKVLDPAMTLKELGQQRDSGRN